MSGKSRPGYCEPLTKHYPNYMQSLAAVAQAARQAGPLEEKSIQLIQLGAGAAIGSKLAVVDHARRAVEAGATPHEVVQALLILTTTIGFPAVAAALKWVHKYLDE